MRYEAIEKLKELIKTMREDENFNLSSDEYMKIIKFCNPISKELVKMLVEQGYVVADPIQISEKDFWGLRAQLELDNDSIVDLDLLEGLVSKLEIYPKVISIKGNVIDLFFQPNQPINLTSENDHVELIYSFIDYINEYSDYGIKFNGWNLCNDEMMKYKANREANISFTQELFNAEEISIYDWDDIL